MSDKKATLIELELHRRKLLKLVGELLEKADELDQHTRYGGQKLPAHSDQRLAAACNELSLLGSTVEQIEQVIKNGRIREAQDALVRATTIAGHLSNKLNEIKRSLV